MTDSYKSTYLQYKKCVYALYHRLDNIEILAINSNLGSTPRHNLRHYK